MAKSRKKEPKTQDCAVGTGNSPSPVASAFSCESDGFRSLVNVLDSLDSVVYATDIKTNEILFANRAALVGIGLDAREVLGKPCWQYMQKDQSGPCSFCTNDKLLDENGEPGEPYTWEFRNTNNNRWYLLQDRAIRWKDGRIARLEIATDISERKHHEKLMQSTDAILCAVSNVAERLLRNGNWQLHLPAILAELGQAARASRVYVFKNSLDASGRPCMNQLHEWVAEGITPQIDNESLQACAYHDAGASRWEAAFRKGEVVCGLVRDFPEAEQAALKPQDIRSLLAVPIHVGGQWWGFMGIDDCLEDRDWSQGEQDALSTAARIFGGALLREKMERNVDLARLQAEEANYAKSQFLANMSHEIRTPLNGVLSMLQLLGYTDLNGEQQELITHARTAGKSLLEIINDILDLSRIEAGKTELEETYFELPDLLSGIHTAFIEHAHMKGLGLDISYAPDVPKSYLGDPVRLRQILFNLVGNAIKFTMEGEVRIRVEKRQEKDGLCELSCTVQDTGIGIAKDKLKTVFSPFTQADGSHTRRFGGSGLGLGIAHRLCGLFGGDISLESTVGKGTTVTFSVLLRTCEEQLKTETLFAPVEKSDRPLNILVAEDNRINSIAACRFLEQAGHRTRNATNGIETLDILSKEEFDCVLMDVQMPEMDGLETIRRIRAGEVAGKEFIPIIALTAHAMKGDREGFIAAGADDYLAKPVDMETLLHRVQMLTA